MNDSKIYVIVSNATDLTPIVGRKGGIIGLGLLANNQIVSMSSFFSVYIDSHTPRKQFEEEDIVSFWKALRYLQQNPIVDFISKAVDLARRKEPDSEIIELIGGISIYEEIHQSVAPADFIIQLQTIVIGQHEICVTV